MYAYLAPGTGSRAWCTLFPLILKNTSDVSTIIMLHFKDEETKAPRTQWFAPSSTLSKWVELDSNPKAPKLTHSTTLH